MRKIIRKIQGKKQEKNQEKTQGESPKKSKAIFRKKFSPFFKNFLMKIKNFCQSKKKRRLVFISLSSLVFLGALYLSIYGAYWKIWPASLRFKIALNRLALSVYQEPYCRLACQLERQAYQEEILKTLERGRGEEKLKKIIFQEGENLNWRLELTGIIFQSRTLGSSQLLFDLENYLYQNPANLDLQNLIALHLQDYNLDLEPYLEQLSDFIVLENNSLNERQKALQGIKNLSLKKAPLYFSLLNLEEESDFKIELLRALNGDEERFSLNTEDLLAFLEETLLSSENSYYLKRLSIFLLNDCWQREASSQEDFLILAQDLLNSESLDPFSRSLLLEAYQADFSDDLDFLEDRDLAFLGEADWEWYFQEK